MHGVVCIGAPSTIYDVLVLSFFLSRLRWHLPGLPELSLKPLLLLLHLPAGLPFFSHKIAIDYTWYVHFILLLWANVCTKVPGIMYEHVAVNHLLFQVLHNPATQVRAHHRATTQASRQT